jgi:hypothetical protein
MPNITAMAKIYNAAMGRSPVHDIAAYKLFKETYNPEAWNKLRITGWNSASFYRNVINSAEGEQWYKNYKITMNAMIQEHTDEWNTDPFGNIVPAAFGRRGHLSKFYCLNDGKYYNSTQAAYHA